MSFSPKEQTMVHQLFESAALSHPQLKALVYGNQSLSYQELNTKADHLANVILREVPHQEIIGLSTTRSLEMIIALIAILKAGKSYLPLDPAYPENRLQQIKEDSGVQVCLCPTTETSIFSGLGLKVIVSTEADHSPKQIQGLSSPNVCILYTSGSTGKPKGVAVEHSGLVNFLNWQKENSLASEGTKASQFCHLSFDASFQEIFVPLVSGGTLYLIADEDRLDSSSLLNFLIRNEINKAVFPYVTLQYLTEAASIENKFPMTLKEVTTGGELLKISPSIRKFFLQVKDCVLTNVYGPTEATVMVTRLKLSGDPELWPALPSIGTPIAGSMIFFLNENLELLPNGETGELCIAGPCLTKGYLHRPELTAEKFIDWIHPTLGGIKIYRTGDLGRYLDNGEIEFRGRKDGQVKIRGNRVELPEIELAIMQQEYIRQAVVILREDTPGRKMLTAYLTGYKSAEESADLRETLATLLPDYMIPAYFIWLEDFPKTTSGKIDQKLLPKPDTSRPDLKTVYKKATTETAKKITTVFQEILEYDRIGTDDNFFELGGNSLLAQKTVAALKYQLNLHLPITKLYQFPTIAGISAFLDRKIDPSRVTSRSSAVDASKDIAVIGMAGRFPGAESISAFWDLLAAGRETTTFFNDAALDTSIPAELRNDSAYVKARGIIKDADQFDPSFFGINNKLATVMDPQQRIFLEIAWEVLEETGHLPSKYPHKVGVFAGSGNNTYYENNVLSRPDLIETLGRIQVVTVNDKDYMASRTAYHLDLKGPAVSVNSACSTSLLAIAEAVNSLRTFQCEAALAGAASITSPINSGHLYQEGSMLSGDGHCRPFDQDSSGTVFSDGAGVVLLKRLDTAERDGDHIYAVIRGIGVNNDGGGKGSFTAPSTEGQADAIAQAIDDAGITASEISYIETHGTGTPIGDPIEFEGLTTAFGPQEQQQFCAIGSVKSNFGHLTHAAGVTGFIKACLSLQHQQIPASLGYQNPNKNIDFKNSPFYVNDSLSDWPSTGKRIAGVSSFGIGGTNVHVILEEYQNKPLVSSAGRPFELIGWSADSEGSREQYGLALASYLQEQPESALSDLGFSLQKSRHEFRQRRFIVSNTPQSAIAALLDKDSGSSQAHTLTAVPGEIVFSFPGQGAQYLNMAHGLYQQEPVYRDAIDRCALILNDYIDQDIRTVIFPAEVSDAANDKLRDTRYTQPALFLTEYALAQLWMYWGISPTLLCGHSIGEYVAAHLSGIFSLENALKLIATRGAMVADLPSGSMLSVRHEVGLIADILPDTLSIAAVNSPMLCVVSGPQDQVAEFSKLLDGREIASKLLFTSHAFHSVMMDPILEKFSKVVAEVPLSAPIIPIISTVTGKRLSDAEAVDPEYWTKHLRNTVLFSDAIETVLTYDNPLFLEIGPGNVTATLIKQISGLKLLKVAAFASLNPQQDDYASMLTALGQLWNHGLQPDWPNFYTNQHRIFLPLPPYQFNRSRYWIDPVTTAEPKLYETNNIELNGTITPDRQVPNETLIMRKTNLTNKIKQVLEDASGIEMIHFEPNKNFLEIGLDSLLLTQVAISLKKEFNLPITFRKLNEEYSTINALADYVDQNTAPEVVAPTVPQTGFQSAPPLPADSSVLGLIAQQIDLLSRQVALLQDSSGGARPVAMAVAQPQDDNSLTEQEKAEIQKPFGATPKIERQASALNPEQAQFLKDFTIRYNKKTQKSKEYAAESRSYMADPRVVSGFKPFTKELVYPLVINRSSGSRLWDLDGHEYIDTLNGFGSNLLGYQPEVIKQAMHEQIEKGYEVGPQHELSAQVSKLICEFTGFDRAALCSTGSEAVLGCIRIARTVTSRSLIVAFTGSYHGVIDEVLVRGTKKLKSFPAAAGIMPEAVHNILVLDYGTPESLAIIKERSSEIAAVLVEPVQSRRPEFIPIEFLKELRAITAASGTALVFDEVITGFRMHPGGAQALFGIKADIASYGKVVGAGVPIGVIAGKKEYMDALDGGNWQYGDQSFPEVGVTYFAGTFVRHPLALISAKTSLLYMKEKGPALQQQLNDKGAYIEKTLNRIIEKRGIPMCIVNFGSLWKTKYLEEIPYSELIFALMREKGIHILDGFPCFITEATSDADIEQIITCFTESLDELIAAGFLSTGTLNAEINNADAVVTYADMPPVKGARLGKDESGNPAWFIEDPDQAGKYLQVELNSKS